MATSVRIKSAELVTLTVLVDGRPLPDEVQVDQIEVQKALNRIPRATVYIRDGSPSEEVFELSASDMFLPGAAIEIKAGYNGADQPIFAGVIVRHALNVTETDGGRLVVSCADRALVLTMGRRSRQFVDLKDSDALARLIREAGLKADVPATDPNPEQSLVHDCSSWDHILMRAAANGRVVRVDDGVVAVRAPDFAEPAFSVRYGEAMVRLDAELDAAAQSPPAIAFAWDPAQQAMAQATAREPAVNKQGDVDGRRLDRALGAAALELQSASGLGTDGLQAWANARQLAIRLARIRGRVAFPGTAGIEPGQTLELEGLSRRFNGAAYVSAVEHRLDAGEWTTQATFGLPPDPLAELGGGHAAPTAAGQRAAARGLQIAKVTQTHDDPKGQRRIKVRTPSAAEAPFWVRMASPYATEGAGVEFLPEVGDEVVLGFAGDDPDAAFCLGALHSGKRPAAEPPDAANTVKLIRTAGALQIRFDDEKKEIQISTPGGQVVTLSDDAPRITLEDAAGNSVALEEAGVTIKSPGDISMSADGKIEIKAGASLTASATADMELKAANLTAAANASLKASGNASAELKAGGVATISGALVKIN